MLPLANWLKDQRRCEVELCGEWNQRLNVWSLCLPVSASVLASFAPTKDELCPKEREHGHGQLQCHILRESFSIRKAKLHHHVYLEKSL